VRRVTTYKPTPSSIECIDRKKKTPLFFLNCTPKNERIGLPHSPDVVAAGLHCADVQGSAAQMGREKGEDVFAEAGLGFARVGPPAADPARLEGKKDKHNCEKKKGPTCSR
jgi:hypothetical protein